MVEITNSPTASSTGFFEYGISSHAGGMRLEGTNHPTLGLSADFEFWTGTPSGGATINSVGPFTIANGVRMGIEANRNGNESVIGGYDHVHYDIDFSLDGGVVHTELDFPFLKYIERFVPLPIFGIDPGIVPGWCGFPGTNYSRNLPAIMQFWSEEGNRIDNLDGGFICGAV